MEYKNKKVLVVGAARSGIGAANLLCQLGADVTLNDIQSEDKLQDVLALLRFPVHLKLGSKADGLLDGMDLVVVSPGVPTSLSFFDVAKQQAIPVIGEMELSSSVCKAPIVAITGTNGKTTTTALMGEIFKKAGYCTHVVGNIGQAFSNETLSIQSDDRVALEVSSFQLETIHAFHPRVSAILNITPDHIDRHGSMDAYIAAKKRIYENQRDDDVLILNANNAYTREMASEVHCRVIFFSRTEEVRDGVCIRDGRIVYRVDGEEKVICRPDEIRIEGPFNLENALAAVAMACSMGVESHAIRHTLATFTGVEHRFENVGRHNGVTFINDSKATNIDAAISGMRSVDRPTILILGGYDKGADFADLVHEITPMIQGIVVLGQTKDKIIHALEKINYLNYSVARSFEDAVRKAYTMVETGGNVLLSPACASFDMFQDFEERGRAFKTLFQTLRSE